jgi:TonB family protein
MIAFVLALSLLNADATQDALNAARDLYASAAYEDALAVLNRVPEASRPPEEARIISQYRAFCLLALGRTAEAERAIETLISREPTYRPASDLSPRVRTAFTDVRRRMLPTIIQTKYAQAKDAFDRKDFENAAAGFGQVVEVMNDPDAAAAVNQPGMADLKMLAGGFRDLALKAMAPPPLPVAVTPVPVPVPAAPPPPAPKTYTAADTNVVPPIVIRQELPPFPGQIRVGRQGAIEVMIDENGLVDFAVMRQSITSAYDNLAIAAAKTWRYKPATVNGVPVRYKKVVQVTVKANLR